VVLDPPTPLGQALADAGRDRRRRRRRGAAGAARPQGRGRIADRRAAAAPVGDTRQRAGQARRRRRLRAARADEPGGVSRHRPDPARLAGALALSRRARRRAAGAEPDLARVESFVAAAQTAFPDAGWEARTRANISPQFSRNLDRFTQFLTLVGLTALIVGGVGVANAVRGFVERKKPDFATLKSVGATGAYVFALSLVEVMLVAAIGVALGAGSRRGGAMARRLGLRRVDSRFRSPRRSIRTRDRQGPSLWSGSSRSCSR
jgi:hypothetical protein